MTKTLIALACTAGIIEAATLATGELHTISGETHPQISLTWTLEDDGLFTVFNEGDDGVITQVNFDSSFTVIENSVDTVPKFHGGLKNLPQGNLIGFTSNYGFTPQGNPIKNGIDKGEHETFTFTSIPDQFTIGIHVQSIGDQDLSDTYTASYTVPEPSAAALLGFMGLGFIMRRNKPNI